MDRTARGPTRSVAGRLFLVLAVLSVGAIGVTSGRGEDEPVLAEQATDFPAETRGLVWGVAFSRDGRTLATVAGSEKGPADGPGELRLFDVARRVQTALVDSPSSIRGV